MSQNIPDNVSGLLITKVDQNTDAEIKGIRPGDIIQEINQTTYLIQTHSKILVALKGHKEMCYY